MSIQDRRYHFMNSVLIHIFKGNSISIERVKKYALKAGVSVVYEPGLRIDDYFEMLNTCGILTSHDGLYEKNQECDDISLEYLESIR